MLGESYTTKAVRAVLGPARSSLFPSRLHIGWLDSEGDLIAMSGMSVSSSAFTEIGGGVANTSAVDAGVAGTSWTIHGVGLYDAPSGGALVLAASTSAPVTPAAGDAIIIPAGGLVFTVVDA